MIKFKTFLTEATDASTYFEGVIALCVSMYGNGKKAAETSFKDKILNLQNGNNLSEIISQAYVHNTRGYCRSIIFGLDQFLSLKNKKAFF